MLSLLSFSAICCAVMEPPPSADLPITTLAPESAEFVLEFSDVPALLAALDDPAVETLFASTVGVEEGPIAAVLEFAAEPLELLQAHAQDGESWAEAIGAASLGTAAWSVESDTGGPDEWVLIGVLHWSSADAPGPLALEAALAGMEEAGTLSRSSDDVDGMTVDVITMGGEEISPEDLFADDLPRSQQVFLGRIGTTTMLSTSEAGMSHLIAAIESSGVEDPIGESSRYIDAVSMLPESAGTVYIDIQPLLSSMGGELGPMAMAIPVIQTMFGTIDCVTVGVSPSSDNTLVSVDVAIHMPEGPDGLTALIADPAEVKALPPFISSDTVSMARFTIDFSDAMNQIRSIISRNPLLAMNLREPLQEYGPTLEKLFGAMGSLVYLTNTVSMPITQESMGSLTGIQCRDSQSFHDVLAIYGPSMGLTPRDFLGHQIHTMPERGGLAGMMPGGLSIGIGGQWIFLGPDAQVEDALRGLGRGDSDVRPEALSRVREVLGDDPCVAWGFTDQGRSMRATAEVLRLQAAASLEDLAALDPDLAAEAKAELDAELDGLIEVADALEEHVASVGWSLTAGDDGFVFSVSVIRTVDDSGQDDRVTTSPASHPAASRVGQGTDRRGVAGCTAQGLSQCSCGHAHPRL